MRRIAHGAACAGCGLAGPWACPWPCGWSWEWVIDGSLEVGRQAGSPPTHLVLYYNITSVHCRLPQSHRLPAQDLSGLCDSHRQRCRQKRERQRDRRPEPDEPFRHERDLPQDHALEGEQRPGDHVGDHLRRAAAALERDRTDRKPDDRAAPASPHRRQTAVRTPSQPLSGPSQPVMISEGMIAAMYPEPNPRRARCAE